MLYFFLSCVIDDKLDLPTLEPVIRAKIDEEKIDKVRQSLQVLVPVEKATWPSFLQIDRTTWFFIQDEVKEVFKHFLTTIFE